MVSFPQVSVTSDTGFHSVPGIVFIAVLFTFTLFVPGFLVYYTEKKFNPALLRSDGVKILLVLLMMIIFSFLVYNYPVLLLAVVITVILVVIIPAKGNKENPSADKDTLVTRKKMPPEKSFR